MKVIISAGGTGGHIYPALAIIDKIKEKEPNSEFLYIGNDDRMECDIVPNAGIPFESIKMSGFNKKNLLKNLKTLKYLNEASKKCKRLIKNFNPDVVIGVGGYVTVPVLKSAHKLKYKTFLHEQNIIPGKSNVYLATFADKIGISFKNSDKHFPKHKVILTGNPCSENAINAKPALKSEFNLTENKKLVLFVMGSLGASTVNDYLVKTMRLFENKNYEILFVTGKSDYERIKGVKFPENVKVVPYVDNLPGLMKKTDLIITRAGASILSEIIALKVPSIIIPSPYVANNHQYKNALDLVNNNAAYMIEEKELKDNVLVSKVDAILSDSKLILKIKANLEKLQIIDSAEIIYNKLKELVGKHDKRD